LVIHHAQGLSATRQLGISSALDSLTPLTSKASGQGFQQDTFGNINFSAINFSKRRRTTSSAKFKSSAQLKVSLVNGKSNR
jgi:hypothetical protein